MKDLWITIYKDSAVSGKQLGFFSAASINTNSVGDIFAVSRVVKLLATNI